MDFLDCKRDSSSIVCFYRLICIFYLFEMNRSQNRSYYHNQIAKSYFLFSRSISFICFLSFLLFFFWLYLFIFVLQIPTNNVSIFSNLIQFHFFLAEFSWMENMISKNNEKKRRRIKITIMRIKLSFNYNLNDRFSSFPLALLHALTKIDRSMAHYHKKHKNSRVKKCEIPQEIQIK